MNLSKLFEIQRKLDAEIEKNHPSAEGEDRLVKRILALQVELGELANEWRGFKFWSLNQEPNTWTYRSKLVDGSPGVEFYNPLLEEYVDCLHFVLSLGIQLGFEDELILGNTQRTTSIEEKFIEVGYYVIQCRLDKSHAAKVYYEELCDNFLDLGEMLGFTWEQIESAYMSKNQTNWERQGNGY